MKNWLRTVRDDWEKASFHDNVTICLTLIIAVATVSYTVVAGFTLSEIRTGSTDTHNLAIAAKDSANWTEHQAKDLFSEQRPRIWAKIPDSVHIDVGKPIRPDIEIFNYGRATGIARARVRFEAAPGVIEKFRDTLRHHPQDFDIPDKMGTLKASILPDKGRRFPIETPELIMSREDMQKLAAGTIDVAIYGRIFYTDLANGAEGSRISFDDSGSKHAASYQSIFCFYIMRDGTTVSACTNQTVPEEEAFTNWAP